MGTEGRIVLAYAKLLSEMQYGHQSSVRPDLFKRILGQYNNVFEGYGQHDSQECINTVLDFVHEDLYRKEKKPYVEMTESDGKSDQDASIEAWNKHVYRNESVILDLFHGQFKSKINCNQCDKISIVFDPFLMVQVPIPSVRYEKITAYYI
jgi:ubiquitin C-terminal hydrolase